MGIFYDWGDSRMHTIPENIDKYQFYKAVLIVIDAVKTFGKQPATAAEAREILGLKPLVR